MRSTSSTKKNYFKQGIIIKTFQFFQSLSSAPQLKPINQTGLSSQCNEKIKQDLSYLEALCLK